jgi:hypothetical protein
MLAAAAVVVVLMATHPALVEPEAVEAEQYLLLLLVPLIPVVVVVVLEQQQRVVLVLSLFVIQIATLRQLLQQAHQQLRSLVATEFINSLDRGALHSNGSLCSNRQQQYRFASHCR